MTWPPNAAFLPERLPRKLTLTPDTTMRLSEADAALGRLAGSGRLLPGPHPLVNARITREAVPSVGDAAVMGEASPAWLLFSSWRGSLKPAALGAALTCERPHEPSAAGVVDDTSLLHPPRASAAPGHPTPQVRRMSWKYFRSSRVKRLYSVM